MKNKDIYREIGNVDEKYIREADPTAPCTSVKRRKMTILAACFSIFAVFLSFWLFLPFSGELEDLSGYADSEYYELMLKVQSLTCKPANYRFKNNFDKYIGSIGRAFAQAGDTSGMPNASGMPNDVPADKYEEVTDNQYDGVIEGDLFKRSDKNIFYLDPYNLILYSYSIEGECKLDEYDVRDSLKVYLGNGYQSVIYLSPDCTKLTVIVPGYNETTAVMLDVSNAADIKGADVVEISGNVITSRMKDGKLLLVTGMSVYNNPDFSDESTFLPQVTKNGECESIPVADIIYDVDCSMAHYSVAVMLDAESFEVLGEVAVLNNAYEVSVSEENIFLACSYSESTSEPGENENETVTSNIRRSEIYVVSYSNGTLENKGHFSVNGTLIDQYALDEKDGVLRLVSETDYIKYINVILPEGGYSFRRVDEYENANLYCIDLETFELIGSVIAFAPEGEEITSVRFEGDNAYVCTAERINFKDPVFFFDLSDMSNITYSDTGIIEGYSTSLVELEGGYLLGIGYGDTGSLKFEVYKEKNGAVVSVCDYEVDGVDFSEDYKSYYINRKENLFGLMTSTAYASDYILVHFDGGSIMPAANVKMERVVNEDWTRATIVDGTLFIFAQGQFKAIKLEQ